MGRKLGRSPGAGGRDDAAGVLHRVQQASLRANMDLAVGQKLVKPFDLEAMVWKP